MGRRPSDEVAQRNEALRSDYLNGMTYGEVARKYGLSISSVTKALRGLERGDRQPSRKKKLYLETRGNLFSQIGQDIMRHRTFTMNMTTAEYARLVNMTPQRLTATERGGHDPTLSELIQISEVMKVELSTLLANRTPGLPPMKKHNYDRAA
jgi:DNA-binding XRE family transcriptional regulator